MGRAVKARIVLDLAYGDAGKGSWVDHLVRKHGVKYVVRFNGGAQAAHHVWTPEGLVHCFQQFGSGTFVPGTRTILTRFMLLDPQYLFNEAEVLSGKGVYNPLQRLIVSADAPVITPFNRLLNQIQEIARSHYRHGSCGFGIGVTQNDVETLGDRALYVRDFTAPNLKEKLVWLQQLRLSEARPFENEENVDLLEDLADVDIDYYVELFRLFGRCVQILNDDAIFELIRTNDTIFEAAQGVMLDQDYGTFPHCTRSYTTARNALEILELAGFEGEKETIGLLRGYGVRHGFGPFPTEDLSLPVPPCDNSENPWQGVFRVGWFDAVTARYALQVVGGVDVLAITNLDRMNKLPSVKVATLYNNTDQRFFSASGELLVPDQIDLEWLRARTMALQQVVPEYVELPGWTDTADGVVAYLHELEKLIKHPIHAYSASRDHRKIYL